MALTAATATAVTVVTTAETVAVTSPNVQISPPGNYLGHVIRACIVITPGSGCTALALRIRQGSGTTGTLVGSASNFPYSAGGAATTLVFSVLDSSPYSQYSVTVSQISASGNASIGYAYIDTDSVAY